MQNQNIDLKLKIVSQPQNIHIISNTSIVDTTKIYGRYKTKLIIVKHICN